MQISVVSRQVPDIPAGAKFRTLTRRHQGRFAADEGGSRRGGRAHAGDDSMLTSVPSDMDRWLEHVFDQALDGTVDDLDDERTLSGRLKGGGDNPNQPSKVVYTDTIRYDTTIFTCAQKQTSSQLSLPHGTINSKNSNDTSSSAMAKRPRNAFLRF